jgi:hypothetical protein
MQCLHMPVALQMSHSDKRAIDRVLADSGFHFEAVVGSDV